LILAIALGDFDLILEKGDLREVVKHEIWKAEKRELKGTKSKCLMEMKNLLLYYRYGSSRKKKKFNYLMQLGGYLIEKAYQWETIGMTVKKYKRNVDLCLKGSLRLKRFFERTT
jgi:hypothetical protein